MTAAIELAEVRVTVGVDTHADVHVAAAVDQYGRLLGTTSVPSTASGHGCLTAWAQEFGVVERVGVEGTGSYGAGLTRHLFDQGISVVEVVRPNRQTRRRRGKTDAIDAEAAARSVLAGIALGTPKTADGAVEMIRTLRLVRRSAMKARTQAASQLRAVLVTAGDNPERLRSESAFAHLCGVSPIPASSGKTNRHRLNRGGNRDANHALYVLALGRLSYDERTRAYAARRTAEGKTKREIIRCIKRYLERCSKPCGLDP